MSALVATESDRGRIGGTVSHGKKNPADILTKHVESSLLDEHVGAFGMRRTQMRNEYSLRTAQSI